MKIRRDVFWSVLVVGNIFTTVVGGYITRCPYLFSLGLCMTVVTSVMLGYSFE